MCSFSSSLLSIKKLKNFYKKTSTDLTFSDIIVVEGSVTYDSMSSLSGKNN